jgi:hypothetical protein
MTSVKGLIVLVEKKLQIISTQHETLTDFVRIKRYPDKFLLDVRQNSVEIMGSNHVQIVGVHLLKETNSNYNT